ncbi:hypothetical protein CGZ75_13060 [Paenibacillus herberti]|uniref:Winged helix-turn helix domain-containing protein n=1 Tax=Paenibacillus herberti TaxID=1619309 RepID=A0A229NW30_9BACL|nr:hypothetical protein CGZ75_13060 [Paenibacillus herberti]
MVKILGRSLLTCWFRCQGYVDAELIQTWIHCEFGRSFTLRGVSKLLVRLGFNYTKATYTLDFP